ncbi:MAG TPA: tRNA-intron lyase [Thermoprotei archaeon]|nr:tRNA-intron lyase [Thermoprotei archaeon]
MIEAIIENNEVIIKDRENGNKLYNDGYGIWCSNGLKLFPVEVLYLMEKEKITVKDVNKKLLSFRDLLRRFITVDKKIWIKYMIYNDLKKRGFWIKPGFSDNVEFLISEGGKSEIFNYIVIGLEEVIKLSFNDLMKMVNEALRSNKELILAIVDKEGNISYYTVTRMMR